MDQRHLALPGEAPPLSLIKTGPCLNHRLDNLVNNSSSSSNSSFSNYRSSNRLSNNNSNNICHNNSPLIFQYLPTYKTLRYYYKAIMVESKHLPTWTVTTMVILYRLHKLRLITRVWLVPTISIHSRHSSQRGHPQDRVPHNPPRILTWYLEEMVLLVSTTKAEVLQMDRPRLFWRSQAQQLQPRQALVLKEAKGRWANRSCSNSS